MTVVLAEDAEERFLLQQRPQKGLLAGLWQPLLWEGEALSAEEVCARLEALGLACESIEPLPAAKHIFSHIEWADERLFCLGRQSRKPGGRVSGPAANSCRTNTPCPAHSRRIRKS